MQLSKNEGAKMPAQRFHLMGFSLFFLLVPAATLPRAGQLAFPTAEGFGKYVVGGRGGKVYEVTNLKDGGPGSLRAAVSASGPRTVVFRVSGTIDLKSDLKIRNPYITIAGQTAPGDGICLKGYTFVIGSTQIIVRYIRVRLGPESSGAKAKDAIKSSGEVNHVILDHISASWSVDEVLSIYNNNHTTIQWCMITEALNSAGHEKNMDHGFGGIWGGKTPTVSSHHNLFAHNSSRNPRPQGSLDHRNNVIYNWKINSLYGGESHTSAISKLNVVANYYKPGPATPTGNLHHRIAQLNAGDWYITGNYVYGYPEITADTGRAGCREAREPN
jgi:pectate lyase